MMKPRLLDLFCGAGGAAMGYSRAGFDVTGVDIKPQPHYPFAFILGDALEYVAAHGAEYDAIHASPPCQAYSVTKELGKARNGSYYEHPELVDPTRELLQSIGKPFVIENVVGAPLNTVITLCGTMFGLKVYRHRRFESSIMLLQPPHFPHNDRTPSAGNGLSPKGFISVCGSGGVRGLNAEQILAMWSSAMGIDWMDRQTLAQAIPPAYTQFIGAQLSAYLSRTPAPAGAGVAAESE